MVLRLVVLLFLVQGEYIIHILYNVKDLMTVFDATFTSTVKLQRFSGNSLANNFF